ncbi:MAG TPA: membrane protein insertion efficiency factor YidD [Dehalococcoidia bacterium]|nr:membrane protein insertion efficiency factor YidD [Dehalococcoidia bacterium]
MRDGAPARRLSPPSRFAVRFIETYQGAVSPMLGSGKCRFQPTCSHYGLETYRTHGFLKATAKTAWRLLRCNPWNRGPRLDPP